ncbi:MAG: YeaH/YhbH family protein [Gammaproteobacteria bacterium]|nr:YeaH/YhbH family protein [Gammaproteobacteria bacterium]
MAYIVDRRINGKNKSAVNRQRFLQRYKKHIKKAVSESISQRSITNVEQGESISIPQKDIAEPIIHHGQGGKRSVVHPGNKEFQKGDQIPRPSGGGAGSGGEGEASDSGEGEDAFVFQITQDEFLEFLFEDLELPNLVKRQLSGAESFKQVHGGIISEGSPSRINIGRSMRSASARRTALGAASKKRLRALQAELTEMLKREHAKQDQTRIKELKEDIEKLQRKIKRIPFVDTFDLRYNLKIKQPQPVAKAVMFCIMDVSGSMTQVTKDIAKRFFILLYMFLKRNYKRIDVVFIRHHTIAKEVDEEEFFYSRETGGTIVSSALKMMNEIVEDRYSPEEWNIYAAQASDGDNWNDDSPVCGKILTENILPIVQHFAYLEITPRQHQALWHEYAKIQATHSEEFAMQQLVSASDIFPVFRELFQKASA